MPIARSLKAARWAVGPLLLLWAGSVAGATPAKATVTAAVQVTGNPNPVRAHSTPLLARDARSGALAISEVDVRGSRECAVHVSLDDGRSWFRGGDIMVRPYTDCSVGAEYGPHTMPFFDRDGTLLVVFTANDPQDFFAASKEPSPTYRRTRSFIPRNLYLARSTDQGRTFVTRLVYEGPKGKPHQGYNYAPVGAVDPADPSRIYVGWAQGEWQSPEEPVKAVVAASSDGGKTFGPPIDISIKQGSEHPWVSVGRGGVVHAAYWSKGFGKPLASPFLPIPIARQDPVPIYHVRSTDQGKTWSRQEIDPGSQKYYRPPVVAADPNSDAVYLAWYGVTEPMNFQLDGDGKARANIFLRTSTDGGRTWKPRLVVNDDPGSGVNHLLPGLAVAPNGRLDVAWNDFRLSPGAGASPDREIGLDNIYHAFSENRGATFSPSMRISDRSINRSVGVWSNNVGSRVAVGVASADAAVYFAWQDSRNGNAETQAEDVYFASRMLSRPGVVPAGRGPIPVWAVAAAAVAMGMGVAMAIVWLVARGPRGRGAVA